MRRLFIFFLLIVSSHFVYAREVEITSPDERIDVIINDSSGICFSVFLDSTLLFSANDIYLESETPSSGIEDLKIRKVVKHSVSDIITPVIKEKRNKIPDIYNELEIKLNNDILFFFRVYDEGFSYRFRTMFKDDIIIKNEFLNLHFREGDSAWFQQSRSYRSPYEASYRHKSINELPEDKLISLPLLIHNKDKYKVVILESALAEYPGMWFKKKNKNVLSASFAPLPIAQNMGKKSGTPEIKTADYISVTSGNRYFPWRVFVLAKEDKDLLTNQLVYILADECKIKNTEWIKPGKVILDWWGKRNIYGVDFKAGINTQTAMYFIDFASEFGIDYFLFDEGWTNNENILEYNPDLNMEAISAYAKEKGVGLMVWLFWETFEKQMDDVFTMLEKWDIKGIKIDFMNRSDQLMVNFYHKVANEAAKREMIVDFHGAYKPSGLRRMYPNVLTREALLAYEYNGFTDFDSPVHHNLLPYIRMVAGPMDYIPATLNNASKQNFRPVDNYPMSQGTRTHSIALSVIFESPLRMIPDAPSDYYREKESTEFIANIPVEWDSLIVLEAKLGEYTVIARKYKEEWYLAAITNWQERDFIVPFNFLGNGEFMMESLEDGVNAGTRAIDYKKQETEISRHTVKNIHLEPGGGWIARIYKKSKENKDQGFGINKN